MNKLVILDRDGVINEDSDNYIKSVDEWIPIPGSAEAIAQLSSAGYLVAVATNQSGIARNYFSLETLKAMHNKMEALVNAAGGHIDGIFFCPHGPDDRCQCRKPSPGLITQIEKHFGQSAEGAFIVGDSKRDLEAGLARGCTPILVRTGKGERTLAKGLDIENVIIVDDLQAAATYILTANQ
ncbi:D-glycero-beta-D-manno-heptose-1,7-bisphosphate 7-phosphatase [Motiliproteus sp. MSK22-1]|nr:D-glycero-beta-D-manno-heptose 1,7-bisphosphate 7-phosphatase [Motiliproteus sp. MSK22-1]OMH39455.1 D-glycero-beta-D-manno-heptose-1,7-bisphosphate 7-phosphatase [Motiliproteus sp. MSK22-1]